MEKELALPSLRDIPSNRHGQRGTFTHMNLTLSKQSDHGETLAQAERLGKEKSAFSTSVSSYNVPRLPLGKMPQNRMSLNQARPVGGGDEPQTARPSSKNYIVSSIKEMTQKAVVTAREPSGTETARRPTSKHDGRESTDERRLKAEKTHLPLTPAKVLKYHIEELTEFEQGEVLDYPQIWNFGQGTSKIRGTASSTNNHGYDDERGDYQIVLHDHVLYRYEVISPLGKGSFGQVVRAYDYKTNGYIAVKLIRNKKRFHHQALVEVKILEFLRERDSENTSNVVHISDYFYFRNHLCITFELLSINLYEFIKNNNFQGLSLGLIRRFAIQLLTALRFLRKQRVIHCDFKPENVLLKNPTKSGIKVIDFGSSCFEDERVYSYIQSRFYRSPEVILGVPYDVAIDMWSFGCILAELYTGYPLFPGENEVEQLACIMEVLGLPPQGKILESATRKKMFFDSGGNPRLVPNSRGKKRRPGTKDLQMALRTGDSKFIDFLQGCLQWDPRARFRPDDALQHEWILDGYTKYTHSSEARPLDSSSKRKVARQPQGSVGQMMFPPIEHKQKKADANKRIHDAVGVPIDDAAHLSVAGGLS